MNTKAIWNNLPNCVLCINSGIAPPEYCPTCLKDREEEVEIVSFGTGWSFGMAIIKREDGTLRKVNIRELKIVEENKDEN